MAENNMRIWDALSKTDPKHTKPFSRAGGFKGTATKPIWLTMRLTEKFGPCGVGWGMSCPEFQTVPAGEEILVFCTVSLWYKDGDQASAEVYGVGGDKVLSKRQSGTFANDEAFKASYTDALSNAMKQIGVSADIHMGLFDDSKYRDEVAREFAESAPAPPPPPGPSSANGRRMAADDPHLIDATREKGKLPGSINTPAAAANAVQLIGWVRKAIDIMKDPSTDEHVARDIWIEKKERIAVIETALPLEYERLLDAYNQALERKVAA